MGEGRSGKRDLAVQIDKPSDQESTEEEQFPSPRPLYTPTAKEVDDTLENAMGAMRSRAWPSLNNFPPQCSISEGISLSLNPSCVAPAADTNAKKLTKSLSLSIDKPNDTATAVEEPPSQDVLPTPSAKEVESALEADMKGWKGDDAPEAPKVKTPCSPLSFSSSPDNPPPISIKPPMQRQRQRLQHLPHPAFPSHLHGSGLSLWFETHPFIYAFFPLPKIACADC